MLAMDLTQPPLQKNAKTNIPLAKKQRFTPGFDPKNPPSGRPWGFPENRIVQSTRF